MNLRQGDVFIERVAAIPDDAVKVKRDNGKVVLAYGETTGHSHAVLDRDCELLESPTKGRFLSVLGGIVRIKPVSVENITVNGERAIRVRDGNSGLTYRFPASVEERARDAMAIGSTLVEEGVTLRHEEHDALVLPPGVHALPGQREYVSSEMAPLPVAD